MIQYRRLGNFHGKNSFVLKIFRCSTVLQCSTYMYLNFSCLLFVALRTNKKYFNGENFPMYGNGLPLSFLVGSSEGQKVLHHNSEFGKFQDYSGLHFLLLEYLHTAIGRRKGRGGEGRGGEGRGGEGRGGEGRGGGKRKNHNRNLH